VDNRQSPSLAVLVISWSVATAIILHREVFGIEFGKAIISIITGPALSDGRPCVPVSVFFIVRDGALLRRLLVSDNRITTPCDV